MQKGDWVVIYSIPVVKIGEVGEAELIEKLGETLNTERWLVRFRGEAKLEKRSIGKPDIRLTKRILDLKKKYQK